MRRLFTALGLAFAVLAAGCDDGGSTYLPVVKPGHPAPDFQIKDMDGEVFRLSNERGRVVVLYFWRYKCEECVEGLESLEKLYRRYRDRGLEVVGVDADSVHSATRHEVRDLMERRRLSFRVIYDENGFVAEAFQVMKAPAAYVIGRDGVLVGIIEGARQWTGPEATALVEAALEGSAAGGGGR
ncbi:MAG TPA: TlpA family protein disulfide reductase [Deltaproteobacteria bacterium]|nr:TlpA family protein disulfide reductase [Deltaproteobacteria bacterium]